MLVIKTEIVIEELRKLGYPVQYEHMEKLRSLHVRGLPAFCFVSPKTWVDIILRYQTSHRFTDFMLGDRRAMYWSGTIVLFDTHFGDDEIGFADSIKIKED